MVYGTYRVTPVILLVFVLVFGSGCPAASAAKPGPEDSIGMLQKGIDERDRDLVEKYMDIDALVGKAVDQLLADEEVLREAGKNPAIALVLALGGNGGEALRTLLAAEAREYVGYGVSSGAFAGKPEKTASNYQSIFGKVFRGGEKDRKRFGPATVKSREKDTAIVSTTLLDGPKRVYPLDLKLERQSGVWRIVGLANTDVLTPKRKEAK